MIEGESRRRRGRKDTEHSNQLRLFDHGKDFEFHSE
jgi:hypothetical protein